IRSASELSPSQRRTPFAGRLFRRRIGFAVGSGGPCAFILPREPYLCTCTSWAHVKSAQIFLRLLVIARFDKKRNWSGVYLEKPVELDARTRNIRGENFFAFFCAEGRQTALPIVLVSVHETTTAHDTTTTGDDAALANGSGLTLTEEGGRVT